MPQSPVGFAAQLLCQLGALHSSQGSICIACCGYAARPLLLYILHTLVFLFCWQSCVLLLRLLLTDAAGPSIATTNEVPLPADALQRSASVHQTCCGLGCLAVANEQVKKAYVVI
jgi:hypothetical protein